MILILPNIMTLVQHLSHLRIQSEDYRPKCCPDCGKAGLWHHGHYRRKANRRSIEFETDDPILIPRFLCPECTVSCAMLPEVIPPHRHYLWALQQVILLQLLNGHSLNAVSKRWPPSRKTISRWWRQLKSRFTVDSDCLRSHFAQLGRTEGLNEFWLSTLAQMPLSTALFRLTVLGPLASSEHLPRGELKRILADLASRSYNIPATRRCYLSEKTIESWYYAWKKDGIDGLVPQQRNDKDSCKLPDALQELILTAKWETLTERNHSLVGSTRQRGQRRGQPQHGSPIAQTPRLVTATWQ